VRKEVKQTHKETTYTVPKSTHESQCITAIEPIQSYLLSERTLLHLHRLSNADICCMLLLKVIRTTSNIKNYFKTKTKLDNNGIINWNWILNQNENHTNDDATNHCCCSLAMWLIDVEWCDISVIGCRHHVCWVTSRNFHLYPQRLCKPHNTIYRLDRRPNCLLIYWATSHSCHAHIGLFTFASWLCKTSTVTVNNCQKFL